MPTPLVPKSLLGIACWCWKGNTETCVWFFEGSARTRMLPDQTQRTRSLNLDPVPMPKPTPRPSSSSTPCSGDGGRIESRHEARAEAQVVPDAERCVQCGICSYNCPMGIDVRAHAHRGLPIHDSHCLTCSECVKRCPRGVLSFERIPLFTL